MRMLLPQRVIRRRIRLVHESWLRPSPCSSTMVRSASRRDTEVANAQLRTVAGGDGLHDVVERWRSARGLCGAHVGTSHGVGAPLWAAGLDCGARTAGSCWASHGVKRPGDAARPARDHAGRRVRRGGAADRIACCGASGIRPCTGVPPRTGLGARVGRRRDGGGQTGGPAAYLGDQGADFFPQPGGEGLDLVGVHGVERAASRSGAPVHVSDIHDNSGPPCPAQGHESDEPVAGAGRRPVGVDDGPVGLWGVVQPVQPV